MKAYDSGFILSDDRSNKDEQKSLSETIFKYLRYWKWFVASIIVCVALALVYLQFASPTYEVNAKILLENSTNNDNSSREYNFLNTKNNTDNELEVLKTSYLIELAVRKSGIYASYYDAESFKKPELYGANCPISVFVADGLLDSLKRKIDFEVEVHPNGSYIFNGTYQDAMYSVSATAKDSQVDLPFGLVYFNSGTQKPSAVRKVGVTLSSPSRMADNILGNMDVSLSSETTTAIGLTLRTSNQQKGIDFMNAFLDTYKQEDIKDQEIMANNTSAFLDNLLTNLGNELGIIEERVENFKQKEGITNISSETQLFIQRTGQYEQRRLEVGTQLGIVRDLESYINKSENRFQLLPSGIGIESASLNSLIGEYNNLLLERKRLSRTATENNQVMIDLADRIEALFKTVQSSLSNEKRNLMISQQDIIQKDRENSVRIQSIPRQERAISDLSRQQSLKSQLYLFLLQKRDETFLNNAAVAPKFKLISNPRSNGIPVAPKGSIILLVSIVCGFFFPVFGISLRDMLHYTVENKDELKLISSVPILGEIPKGDKSGNMLIKENANDGFTEMFRLLRTNLLFVLNEPWKQVINVVSSINGEGKTSITLNLALSLAILDKKVLMICLDIRKPMLGKMLGLDNEIGVTQYLSGHLARTKLIFPSGLHSNLWLINAGPVPPNPNELLAKPALDELIEFYRKQFDYIIIDTPPIGAVSDGLLLNRFADVNLYVVRADYTPKNDILDANDIYRTQKLNNMYFVFNAANMQKKSTYYGCRKKYGTNYGYGYYGQNEKQK